jgi:RNA polymerase sigma-70 factor (ECF subfamily)
MRNVSNRLVTGTHDEAAFEDVFRSHYRAVRAYVTSHYTGLDADEVVASTFHVAWQRFDEIVADTQRAWLIGVARNLIRNADRSRRRRARFVDALMAARPTVSVGLAGSRVSLEDIDALRSAFGRLRPGEQEILLLAAWEGLERDALGVVLGVSASTATVRLFRARQRLRHLIAEEAADE